MATLADMEHFSPKKATSEPIEWLISSQPVVAVFAKKEGAQSDQHLGLQLNHNCESDVLVLWIGLREKTHELLVTLTIRVQSSYKRHTRKQASRRGRLMFLIVPVESLVVDCADVAYHALSKDGLLAPLLDSPSDVDSANSRVLRMSFDIGTAKSFVIMPSDPVAGTQQRPLINLLDKFKSLSEVSRFCLYANHDGALESSVQYVQTMLNGSIPMSTPVIELRAFYPGRRRAAINAWEHQGWRQREEESTDVKGDISIAAPPYPGRPESPQLSNIIGQNPAASTHLPPALPPPSYTPCALPATDPCSSPPPSGGLVQTNPPTPKTSVSAVDNARITSDPDSNYQRIFSSRTPPPRPSPEPSLSPNYSTNLLSDCSRSRQPSVPSCKVAVSADIHTNVQVLQTSSILPCIVDDPIRACSVSSVVAETPNKKRPSAFEDCNSAKRNSNTSISCAQTQQRPDVVLGQEKPQYGSVLQEMCHDGVPFSPTVLDEDSYRSMLLPGISHEMPSVPLTQDALPRNSTIECSDRVSAALEDRITQWLIQAWSLCPDAHYIFVTDLIELGAEASKEDPVAFDDCRVACTTSLLRYCARKSSDTVALALSKTNEMTREDIPRMLRRLVSWLYVLEPAAKLDVLSELLKLSMLEQQLLSPACEDEGCFDEVHVRYMRQRAEIISSACVRLSREGLACNSDLAVKMLQEKERNEI